MRLPQRPFGAGAVAFMIRNPLGIRDISLFEAAFPTAHLFACLRINVAVARGAARLTTDLPGSALVGRDSHPLDNSPDFKVSSPHSSLWTRIAWSLLHTERSEAESKSILD